MGNPEIVNKTFTAEFHASQPIDGRNFTNQNVDEMVKSISGYMDSVGVLIQSNMDENPKFQLGPFISIYHVPRETAATVLFQRGLGSFYGVGSGEERDLTGRHGPDSIYLKVVSANDQQSHLLLEEIVTSSGAKDSESDTPR